MVFGFPFFIRHMIFLEQLVLLVSFQDNGANVLANVIVLNCQSLLFPGHKISATVGLGKAVFIPS